MTAPRDRVATVIVLAAVVLAAVLALSGCSRSVRGSAVAVGGSDSGSADPGSVDTDQFYNLLKECTIVSDEQLASAVGGQSVQSTFNGAICRWVVSGAAPVGVTFTWFETGTMAVEKNTAKQLGFTTENVRVADVAAFTSRDPQRPGVCGVTANSPARGVYTWWVEPRSGAAAGDPCAGPTKLMQLVLRGGQ